MPVKCICKLCGKPFETYPAEIRKGGGKFCCQEHYHKWVSINKTRSGENSNLWKDAQVEVICKYCGKSNLVYKSQIALRGSNFCDRKCQSKWVSENKSGNLSWNWINKIKVKCPTCGKEHEKQRADVKRHKENFCSRHCYGISMEREKNRLWAGGISFGKYCPIFNYRFRENVRQFFEYKCMMCGHVWTKGEQKLAVHHVYYNKKACCDQMENGQFIQTLPEGNKIIVNGNPHKFVTLCSNHSGRGCHAKTNQNRLYWALYFEKMINEQYGGMSYTPKK